MLKEFLAVAMGVLIVLVAQTSVQEQQPQNQNQLRTSNISNTETSENSENLSSINFSKPLFPGGVDADLLAETFKRLTGMGEDSSNMTSATQSWLTHKNSTFGLEFQYPGWWKKGIYLSFTDLIPVFDIYTPGYVLGDDNYSRISINVQRLSLPPQSLDEYVGTEREHIESLGQFKNWIESKNASLGGLPAHRLAWVNESPSDDSEVRHIAIITITNNSAYQVSYNGAGESYSKFLPIAQRVIDSLKIVEAKSTPEGSNDTADSPIFLSNNTVLESKGLKVLSENVFIDKSGYIHVLGEIQNIANGTTFSQIKVTSVFFDSQRQIIGRDFVYTDPPILNPGEIATFEILVPEESLASSDIRYLRLSYTWKTI